MVKRKELGWSGTDISSGVIQRPYLPSTILGEDYNSDITFDEIQHMLLGDGQVGGVTKAISMAIEQADFAMIPYAGERGEPTKRDLEIATFAEKNLVPLWPSLLSQALDHLWYGFMLFEPVYKIEGGQVWWDRFAPRLPFTIDKWSPKNGHVDKITQYAWNYNQQNYNYCDIPGKNLLRFTHEQRGENFEGTSMLRAGRKHWKYKDQLYLLAAIQQEKFAVGTIVGALPSTATDDDVAKFKEILKGHHSNEYGYIWLGKIADSPDFNIEKCIKILQPEGNAAGAQSLIDLIHHHDILFARSLLAQFVNLGEGKAGTRNLSSDMNNLFLMNLEALTKYIAHVISVGNPGEYEGIKTLVDLNFKNVEGYPIWKCGRTKKTDTAQIAAVIAQLVQSGAMQPDESLETYLRRIVGVPQDKAKTRNPKPRDKTPPVDKEPKSGQLHEQIKLSEYRKLFPYEQNVAFEEIENDLDNGIDEFVAAWRDVLRGQLKALAGELGPVIDRTDLPYLERLVIPSQGELAGKFEAILKKAYRRGQLNVKSELLRQVGTILQEDEDDWIEEEEVMALIAAQASASASRLADKTKRSISYWIIAGLAAASSIPWRGIEEKIWALSDADARQEGRSTNLIYGAGRHSAATKYASLIQEAYSSAVMDRRTCSVCAERDGKLSTELPSLPPYADCLGGSACRCILVYILKDVVTAGDIEAT